MMSDNTIPRVSSEFLAEVLRESGWKVVFEEDKDAVRIVSAVNGVNFSIHFGTKCTDGNGWTDFTMSAPFDIDREVSSVLGAFWNRRNRFARVYRTDKRILMKWT